MVEYNLQKVIEALIFVSEKPLSYKQIQEICHDAQLNEIKTAMEGLREFYNDADRGIHVREVAGGFQFSSNPDCADYLKKLYKTRRVFRLSAPALETLAIIAYKQPITRSEIEFIRGVNVDGVVKTLEDRDLIKIKGRKEVPGRPLLYGTTDAFLHYFGLKSLQGLPTLEEFRAQNLENVEDENSDVIDDSEDNDSLSIEDKINAVKIPEEDTQISQDGDNKDEEDEHIQAEKSD